MAIEGQIKSQISQDSINGSAIINLINAKQDKVYDIKDTTANILLITDIINVGKIAFATDTGIIYKGVDVLGSLVWKNPQIADFYTKTEIDSKVTTNVLNISVNSTINSGLYIVNANNINETTLNMMNITNNNVNNILQLPDFSTNISDARIRIVLLANQSQLTVRIGSTGSQIIIYPSSTTGVYVDGHYIDDVGGGYFSFL